MRIYTMTATFGKLEHETLTLRPGLNILEAPNEWGKSTWCAFLVAMLYGIDSRAHSATKTALADKTRYEPWSGQPMSGRMELCWKGRDITIERTSTKRGPFRHFRAFETATGASVPELTAENCGQMLLGVEKEVFQRAGFIRLSDMPVTQNEALRRRLNDLVTTGDESGAADKLASQLNKLKNECRANRSRGLLPQAETRREQLEQKLHSLRELKEQSEKLNRRQRELEEFQAQLQNHQTALQYEAAGHNQSRIADAKAAEAAALSALQGLEAQCAGLPDLERAQKEAAALEQLQQQMLSLQMESQMCPLPPDPPQPPSGNGDADPETVAAAIAADQKIYSQLRQKLEKRRFPLWIPGLMGLLAGAGLFLLHPLAGICTAAVGLLLMVIDRILLGRFSKQRAQWKAQATQLAAVYGSEDQALWASAAQRYREAYAQYHSQLEQSRSFRSDLEARTKSLKEKAVELTGGEPLADRLNRCRQAVSLWEQLADARREHQHAAALTQTLQAMNTAPTPPRFPDELTHTEAETNRLLSDCASQLRELHLRQGHCQGQMESLGQEAALNRQLEAVRQRIGQLETTLTALTLAQETLATATAQLQKRFAPRISQRAKELFGRLTVGRYDRLSLGEDLSLHVGAQGEDILRSSLWRSEGTVDQLYLALRLAVAEELTPNAPLILDDALVRFDDTRLKTALEILQEESQHKQVLLFTCQSREKQIFSAQ